MSRRLRAVLIGLAALLTAGVVAPAPAGAVTGGTPTGSDYSNVGLILFYDATGRYRCTATLVSPTVLLTAAHCTDGTLGKTIVTFQPDVAKDAAQAKAVVPRAANPSTGYQPTDVQNTVYPWYTGTASAHPNYSGFTDRDNWNDVGVVVLDQSVTGITPATIAPTNYLDRFAQPALNHTSFTLVGYGTEVRKPEEGPRKPTPESYPLIRRYTDVVGEKLTPQILQVNGNPNDVRAGGGSCFGDSGGPTVKNGYVVTVTSYGYTSNCRYLDGLQRVDIPVVQEWLATFGIRPST